MAFDCETLFHIHYLKQRVFCFMDYVALFIHTVLFLPSLTFFKSLFSPKWGDLVCELPVAVKFSI